MTGRSVPGGADDDVAPAAFWEDRYARSDRIWSGGVNATLADVVAGLAPGRALDLGCGEGGDVVWLAQRGWVATGLDISPTAVRRARESAAAAGLPPERARFEVADLEAWTGEEPYDLVTASFLQSPVALDRADVLRRAAGLVAPGGHLLVLSHAAPPPWTGHDDGAHDDGAHGRGAHGEAHAHEVDHLFPRPQDELDALRLDPAAWTTVLAETRRRAATGPAGQEAVLEDTVVLVRRR
ncbi:MAG: class I SAM-dependent methyltransferase [Actinotalea sp.]|nr:class I SAM-dependent methyltransferase [Actinotalea sp.]